MDKHIYLIRGDKEERYTDFTRRVVETGRQVLQTNNVRGLKVTITSGPPPGLSVIPFSKKKIAVVSVYTEAGNVIKEFTGTKGFAGAFSVTEALPAAYEKTWKDGEATPGIGLLTLFHCRKGIDYQTFIRRWHEGHTPLTLKLHPVWNYNRNVVNTKLTDHPAWYDGIVEEHVRERRDLLNVFRFFGKPQKVLYNMYLVYTDTRSFLDYKRIETYLVSEYHLLS